ncbi:hypothetical protein HJG54_20265 [Leptolyngbya sp. NK1-12]|uniref:Uncharacterized protein n=1 Tax=Leptolyngbya sp. NK1-12 TaxID=2547451 RepID=A0AA96WF09_9CYAN|nr:hypothetical protein [Leptolyngbya sp. NK1-12]WNZ24952.1 hypothetical protein HJG54_20265 [Leptolyngbya sp. NK1-12]
MTTEFNPRLAKQFSEQLGDQFGDQFGNQFGNSGINLGGDRLRIWLIGTQEQIEFAIHELVVKQVASDRGKFTPIVPFPLLAGKYISILVR